MSLRVARRAKRSVAAAASIGVVLVGVLLGGCVTRPDPIPRYALADADASLAVVRTRLGRIKTVRGEATIVLTDARGQTVHLDGAYLLATPSRARLRAWKLGQAVFDLTIREDGAWAYVPRDEAKPAAPGLRQSMGRWLALLGGSGDLFTGPAEISGDAITLSRPEGDGLTLRCTIDRPTLTPRQYTLTDSAGAERFSLTLSQYRTAAEGQVWPMKIVAHSAAGTVEIRSGEVEVNVELPPVAFKPPARAEALP